MLRVRKERVSWSLLQVRPVDALFLRQADSSWEASALPSMLYRILPERSRGSVASLVGSGGAGTPAMGIGVRFRLG